MNQAMIDTMTTGIFQFGKHKHVRLDDVPYTYIDWLRKQQDAEIQSRVNTFLALEKYAEERKLQESPPAVEGAIEGHWKHALQDRTRKN